MAKGLLVITGAGASADFGVDRGRLPLMNEWCADLTKRLKQSVGFEVPEILGLNSDGNEFEERLGAFLAWQRALAAVRKLALLGVEPPRQQLPPPIDGWLGTAGTTAHAIAKTIHESLFELFGIDRINPTASAEGYRWLLDACRVLSGDIPVAVATTNYDLVTEAACDRLGIKYEDGRHFGPATSSSHPVRPRGLSQGWSAARTPILHLHGRVGWYVHETGTLIDMGPGHRYNPDWGTPGLLLPDPNKDYGELPELVQMWDEFEALLHQASHAIVIGHSLRDQRLVALLTGASARVAITHHTVHDIAVNPLAQRALEEEKRRIGELVPRASIFPLSMGRSPIVGRELAEWLA